eukprot:6330298-Prymnesium_polylepis.1
MKRGAGGFNLAPWCGSRRWGVRSHNTHTLPFRHRRRGFVFVWPRARGCALRGAGAGRAFVFV